MEVAILLQHVEYCKQGKILAVVAFTCGSPIEDLGEDLSVYTRYLNCFCQRVSGAHLKIYHHLREDQKLSHSSSVDNLSD